MPLTPFHLGPGLFIGEIFEKRVNLVAILLASILVDVRTAYCFFNGCLPLHGLIHTFIGATVLAFFIIIGVYYFRKGLQKITNLFKIKQNYSLSSIIAGSLIGVWVHIILDSFMHFDITPFWPIEENPLLGIISNGLNYYLCTAALVLGLIIYLYRSTKNHNHTNS